VGSVARLTFGGRSVEWIASRGKDQGRAEVWLDGIRIGVIDLYAATTQPPMPVLVRAGLAAGSHTLEVRVLGSKQAASSGTHVNVDAFVVLP
jgi:hypothetical protein